MSDSTKDASRSVTKSLGGRPSSPLARKLAEHVCHHAADGIPHLDLVADLEAAGLSRIESASIVACHASAPAKSVRAMLANACALACPVDRDVVHGVHHEMLAAIAVIKAAGEDASDFWIEVHERAEEHREIQRSEMSNLCGAEVEK